MQNKHVYIVFGGDPNVYKETMEAFNLSFQELGYKTTQISLGKKYTNGFTPPGDFNIVQDAYCTMKPHPGKYNVVFHAENNVRTDYEKWSKVLHVSPLKLCKKSIYFPLGYSKAFDYQSDVSEIKEDIDISFFGKITNTRATLIKNISDKYLFCSFFALNKLRDIAIARTKINLCMKSAPECTFESERANLILSKGKLLFAEENYNGGYGYMGKYLISFNSLNFNKTVERYLNDKIRKEFTAHIKNDIRTNHSFTKYVKEIILEK